MKLRVRGDSLRFRLTQGEVARLLAGNRVSESVHFADGDVLTYSLQASENAAQAGAHFNGREINVDLPQAAVSRWASGDDVGIEAAQPIGGGKRLHIVVEKDFRCLQPRPEEDERDNFPHPENIAEEVAPSRPKTKESAHVPVSS